MVCWCLWFTVKCSKNKADWWKEKHGYGTTSYNSYSRTEGKGIWELSFKFFNFDTCLNIFLINHLEKRFTSVAQCCHFCKRASFSFFDHIYINADGSSSWVYAFQSIDIQATSLEVKKWDSWRIRRWQSKH